MPSKEIVSYNITDTNIEYINWLSEANGRSSSAQLDFMLTSKRITDKNYQLMNKNILKPTKNVLKPTTRTRVTQKQGND